MCGTEKFVANQRRGCWCCSLRTFFFLWLIITGAVAFFEIFVGLAFGSFTRMFTDFVAFLGRESARRGLTRVAWGFHVLNLYAQRFTTVLSLLTTVRGCVDLLGLVAGTWGIFRRGSRPLALFLAITILNFIVDATIVGTSIYLLAALDLSAYAPTLLILIMVFFGWRLLLGPYVMLVIWSLIWIVQVGGTGGEGLSYNEIVDAQKATKEAAAAAEKPGEAEETTISEEPEKKALLQQAETKDLP